MNEVAAIIGVDLAKNVFQLHGAGADGSVVFRKKLSRCSLHGSWRGIGRALSRWRLALARTIGHGNWRDMDIGSG